MARRKNETKSKVNIKPNKDEDESFNTFAYKCNSRKNLNILELNVSQQTTSVAWRKSCFEKALKSTIMENVKKLTVCKVLSPFDRRITALAWHPQSHSILAVGSKGGDIIVCNHNQPVHQIFIKGSGPGGSVTAMKFDKKRENSLYISSLDGTVSRRDVKTNMNPKVFLDTGIESIRNWFTALDVQDFGSLLASGDNKGNVNLLTTDGEMVWKKKLHNDKIHHVEFHSQLPWFFVTSSVDNSVRVWDVRYVKDKTSFLADLKHLKGVTGSYFSPCHGTRILTTDQNHEIKIFSGPLWNLETTIIHPHRFFQHITAIKAQWHPLEDIVVVGRYPDPKLPNYDPDETRSLDFFDAASGELLHQLEPSGQSGIISLNQFNSIGTVLASGMGQHILLWKSKELEAEKLNKGVNDSTEIVETAKSIPKRRVPRNRSNSESDEDLKKRKRPSKANLQVKKSKM